MKVMFTSAVMPQTETAAVIAGMVAVVAAAAVKGIAHIAGTDLLTSGSLNSAPSVMNDSWMSASSTSDSLMTDSTTKAPTWLPA